MMTKATLQPKGIMQNKDANNDNNNNSLECAANIRR
jgi:hypothetical protein